MYGTLYVSVHDTVHTYEMMTLQFILAILI